MGKLEAGVYQHYKGGMVLVLGVARHSETNERLVAYVPLGVKVGPRITVRPYGMFFDKVKIGNKIKPRFTYLGEEPGQLITKKYDSLSGYSGVDRIDD